MKLFNDAFAPYGLPKTAIKPSYGMAEATLFVSGPKPDDEAKIIWVDRAELNGGRIVRVDEGSPGAVSQVSCGYVARSQSRRQSWIPRPVKSSQTSTSVRSGCTARTSASATGAASRRRRRPSTAVITKRQPQLSRAEGLPEDAHWMRTGDLGVYIDGELYVTGRYKDLIIVNGRNHYPQDIEFSAQEATLRRMRVRPASQRFVAAFDVLGLSSTANLETGDRRRAWTGRRQGRSGADRGGGARCGGRASRCHGRRHSPGSGRLDSADVERQDRSTRVQGRLHRGNASRRACAASFS